MEDFEKPKTKAKSSVVEGNSFYFCIFDRHVGFWSAV